MKSACSVLFVCMGNICRSPTAEAVLKSQLQAAGLTDRVTVDSAGTHDYHIGQAPDPRAVLAAQLRGFDLSSLRGRQVTRVDLTRFDYVLAMDQDNLAQVKKLSRQPGEKVRAELRLVLDFLPGHEGQSVPDPYFGGDVGFTHVLDLLEEACQGFIQMNMIGQKPRQ